MPSVRISKQYTFDAAHRLHRTEWTNRQNETAFGKCATLHGHTYTVEVTVVGAVHGPTGMVLNYFDLDAICKPIIEARMNEGGLDHGDLNEYFGGILTTAENIATALAARVSATLERIHPEVKLSSVTVQETPKTKATWYAVS